MIFEIDNIIIEYSDIDSYYIDKLSMYLKVNIIILLISLNLVILRVR